MFQIFFLVFSSKYNLNNKIAGGDREDGAGEGGGSTGRRVAAGQDLLPDAGREVSGSFTQNNANRRNYNDYQGLFVDKTCVIHGSRNKASFNI